MSSSKTRAKQEISELIEQFKKHSSSYKAADYKEATLRIDFLNKFFYSLGWDVANDSSLPPVYREVVTEDNLEIDGRTKSPDYSFRKTGGRRLFFVEAKKPHVNISNSDSPAFQLRRYGWSADLSISVLTSFEYFAVYDCSIKPKTTDSARTARLKIIHYEDYLNEFDYLWDNFSKECVFKGNLENFSVSKKRGTQSVDKDFLESLDRWRVSLASDLNKNNKLDEEQLNYIVQQTIDRIIFLRIAEDRKVEGYGNLNEIFLSKNYYKGLLEKYFQADEKYNSGLFKGNKLLNDVVISNSLLKEIVAGLYYPLSPYEFSVLPVEILGKVYEQFLGKQITLNEDHEIEIEDKPEVRKAGGVFYTHEYIVEYIVENTIGKLVAEKKPEDVSKIRILDPACGSGSFLIGAYQYLLDWHLNYYLKNPPKQTKKAISPLTPINTLTTTEKKRILVNNIFGVDIDHNAVEVTKLSLLLKCLEGETATSIKYQLNLFGEKVLPTLDSNILSGNSLIDLDYSELHIDYEIDRKINPFNWKRGFPSIFKQDLGFDVVVGNPPWGAEFTNDSLAYLRRKFVSAETGTVDSYALFVEKSITLLKENGVLGFITPDTFLRKDDFISFRKFVFNNYIWDELIEAGPLFSQVRDTWCSVFFIKRSSPNKKTAIKHRKLSRTIVSVEERLQKFGELKWDSDTIVPQFVWRDKPDHIIGYKANPEDQRVIEKVECQPRLGTLDQYKISRGEEGSKLKIKESARGTFFMIIPADIERFDVAQGTRILCDGLTRNKVTSIYQHPKIWIIRIQKMRWIQRIVSAVDSRNNTAGMKTLQSITSNGDNLNDLQYLQAILSSKLVNFWCVNYLADDINQSYLSKIPIKVISGRSEQTKYDKICLYSEKIANLKMLIKASDLHSKKEKLLREVGHFEGCVDQLIYELYGLNEEEIRIVEREEYEY